MSVGSGSRKVCDSKNKNEGGGVKRIETNPALACPVGAVGLLSLLQFSLTNTFVGWSFTVSKRSSDSSNETIISL